MSLNPSKSIKNNYKHFKAVIGTVSEELDYFGESKAVLSLHKVYLKTRGDKPIADYLKSAIKIAMLLIKTVKNKGIIHFKISVFIPARSDFVTIVLFITSTSIFILVESSIIFNG